VAAEIGLVRRFEKIISLVAVVGVLLHAGLLVRHNGIMLDAAFDRLALSFAGGVICHGDGVGSDSGMPAHSDKVPNCPVCFAATLGAAVLPPMVALPGRGHVPYIVLVNVDQLSGQRAGNIRPPSRAPPQAI
jgi:hypothetical protein